MREQETLLRDIVVVKRSGQRVLFDGPKIALAIKHAFDNVYEEYDEKKVNQVYLSVLDFLGREYRNRKTIHVEDIQDAIEEALQKNKFDDIYQAFHCYRERRAASREAFSIKQQHKFVKAIEKIDWAIKNNQNDKPLELMNRFGSVMEEEFSKVYLLENKYVRAHEEGSIYIHHLDSYALATTAASNLNLLSLEGSSIEEFTSSFIQAIYHVKQEQSGEQVISCLDYLYEKKLVHSFYDIYFHHLVMRLEWMGLLEYINIDKVKTIFSRMDQIRVPVDFLKEEIKNEKVEVLFDEVYHVSLKQLSQLLCSSFRNLLSFLNRFDFQMNNNKTTISLGLSDSFEGHFIIDCYLSVLASLERLPYVTTLYKVTDTTESAFLEKVISLIQNQKNVTLSFLGTDDYQAGFATMEGNVIDYTSHGVPIRNGRVLLSSTSINLAKLGLKHAGDLKAFYEELEDVLELVRNQLLQRFDIQANKYKENYTYLFSYNMLYDSKKLDEKQKVRKVLKNGFVGISFVGLGECVSSLTGKNVFSEKDLKLGLEIIGFMKEKVDLYTSENKLEFMLYETDNLKVKKDLIAIDKSVFGLQGLLKKEYYLSLFEQISFMKLDHVKELEIYDDLERLSAFRAILELPRNCSDKRIMEYMDEALKRRLPYLIIQVGKNDY